MIASYFFASQNSNIKIDFNIAISYSGSLVFEVCINASLFCFSFVCIFSGIIASPLLQDGCKVFAGRILHFGRVVGHLGSWGRTLRGLVLAKPANFYPPATFPAPASSTQLPLALLYFSLQWLWMPSSLSPKVTMQGDHANS